MDESESINPSVSDVALLLSRGDLPSGDVNWWLSVFAKCNAGLIDPSNDGHALRGWAEVYLTALDKASSVGGIGIDQTLHRKANIYSYLMHELGVSEGDHLLDPRLCLQRIVQDIGIDIARLKDNYDRVIEKLRNMRAGGRRPDSDTLREIQWISGVRLALDACAGIVKYLPEESEREQYEQWIELRKQLQ